jgi:hypothetical protein
MQVNNEIEEEQLKHSIDAAKRYADTRKTKRIRELIEEIAQRKRENDQYAKSLKLEKQ